MNGWFLAIIIIYMLSLGLFLANHGKKQEVVYSFWSKLIVVLIELFLIYKAIQVGF